MLNLAPLPTRNTHVEKMKHYKILGSAAEPSGIQISQFDFLLEVWFKSCNFPRHKKDSTIWSAPRKHSTIFRPFNSRSPLSFQRRYYNTSTQHTEKHNSQTPWTSERRIEAKPRPPDLWDVISMTRTGTSMEDIQFDLTEGFKKAMTTKFSVGRTVQWCTSGNVSVSKRWGPLCLPLSTSLKLPPSRNVFL